MEFRDQLQATLGSHFSIERELGGGGMSRVFVAEDAALGRKVVVKVLAPELAVGVSADRFTREIKLLASLQQANIVPLLSAGNVGGLPYYTMPFVDGLSLRARLSRGGAFPFAEAVSILRDLARGLAYAHAQGLVHRDIKPDNVLLSGDAAVITDFGIAKALTASRTSAESVDALTKTGMSLGTPAYMAPEQAAADPNVDHRADIYALGCVAYELLTGHPPFHGRTPQQQVAAHMTEHPVSPGETRPDVPAWLTELVLRCLEKSPNRRPQSARDILQTLDSVVMPADPLRRGRLRGVSILAAVVVGVLAWPIWKSMRGGAGESSSIIAVLPLDNLGGDTSNAFFADGMSEELTNQLTRIPTLRVISRSSVLAATGSGQRAPRDVGRVLHATVTLGGSVRRAGSELRLALRLTNTKDGTDVWSEIYDRPITTAADIFRVQEDIARAVASALRVRFTASSPAGQTASMPAHDLYLRGRAFQAKYSELDFKRAIQLYDSALAIDSTYALAFAAQAESWFFLADSWLSPSESYPRAKQALERALRLNPDLAEAQAQLAAVAAVYDWNFSKGRALIRRAFELAPNSPQVLEWAYFILVASEDPDSAIAVLRRAAILDPLNRITDSWIAQIDFGTGRIAEGCAQVRRALVADSANDGSKLTMASCLIASDSVPAAISLLHSIANGSQQFRAEYARTLALGGRRVEAKAVVDSIEVIARERYVSAPSIASVYVALRDTATAFRWLERTLAERSAELSFARLDPRFRTIRGDPRFQAILGRMKPLD